MKNKDKNQFIYVEASQRFIIIQKSAICLDGVIFSENIHVVDEI